MDAREFVSIEEAYFVLGVGVVKIYKVLDQYPIEIRDEESDQGYFHTIKARPGQVKRGERCLEKILDTLPKRRLPAVEFFGGVGRFSTLLHFKLNPTRHLILEQAADLVRHLKRHVRDWTGTEVRRADSLTIDLNDLTGYLDGAFVSLDFSTFTLKDLIIGSPKGNLFCRVLSSPASFVCLTDSAVSRVHLHYGDYTNLLRASEHRASKNGPSITSMRDYVKEVSCWVSKKKNWFCKSWTNHSGASYLLFERGKYLPPIYSGRVNAEN